MVERAAVNRDVVGSSPTSGAIFETQAFAGNMDVLPKIFEVKLMALVIPGIFRR